MTSITEIRNLLPSTEKQISKAIDNSIIVMLSTMPSQGASGVTMAIRLAVYHDALGDLNPNDVIRVIKKFVLGDLGDGKFAPTPAQIRQAITDPCYGQHDLRFTPDDRLSNEQYWKKRQQLKVWGAA